ncbi:DNA polymerase IV [Shewanella yunxiaonensis]|uniref:DNA polymerase IV n=1 Tax=Shewanella yunxiaonensis TaxID=2829809 RepID=A0ABX7YQQ1_9GAMM|nr:DNA polymerase IV [Shewanella yunxiaonensis]QUN04990.1 DNA polymerase IV [Shewanella yunxiaonensis]
MKKIIHVDMDCYYAAVEMRDFPEYRGKPLAVGGSRERRGVISTCNYEARKFGIHSAMATGYALKLCPALILLPGRMEVYKAVSRQIHTIFERYTDKIEPLSLDEAYLDVSDCQLHQSSATLIAEAIRRDILAETGLTASAGVAPVKFLAKVASEINKPNGQYVITPESLPDFIAALPLEKIPGVGKVTASRLAEMQLFTCADVQRIPQHQLVEIFGKFGQVLHQRAFGIDARELNPNRIRKSIGVETTLARDIYSAEQCRQVMQHLLKELAGRFQRHAREQQIGKLVVKLKFADFRQTTIESRAAELSPQLFDNLLTQAWLRANGRGIRLVGIAAGLSAAVTKEPNANERQLTLNI